MLIGYAANRFSFSRKVLISSRKAVSMFSCIAFSYYNSSSAVSSSEMSKLILAYDFLSSIMEA